MLRAIKFLLVAALSLLTMVTAFGQDDNQSRSKQQTPTIKGSTGLFNLPTAETLRQGEFSFGLHGSKFNRDPGDIDITVFPVSFTLGLHDRVEFFASYEVYKRVHSDGIVVNRIAPNGPLLPSRLPNGQVSYYNDTPFLDVGFGDGQGDLWTGFKFSLLSEFKGDPVGLAIQPIARFHTSDHREHQSRGLTSGLNDYGFDLILSKGFGGGGVFTINGGLMWAEDFAILDRQNRINYGIGIGVPLGTPTVHFIGELVGSTFFGDRTTGLANPRADLDLYGGLRIFPAKWLAIGGAYNYHLNRLDDNIPGSSVTDRHGWFAQVVLQRKINHPPTIKLTAEQNMLDEGQSTRINAEVYDPDDDVLTLKWKAPRGGKLTQQDTSAIFDSTGLEPGDYPVMAEVTDGEHVASDMVTIQVKKRKLPPTIECTPATTTLSEGGTVTLRARASDPNQDELTYAWTVNGQAVTNNSPEFQFGTTGREAGTYTIRVTVTDVDGMSANCEFRVTIERKANQTPTCTVTLDKVEVTAGETVVATAQANDPDGGRLTYSWMVDNQSRSGNTNSISIDTRGMAGGTHTVTVVVNDEQNAQCRDTKSFSIREKVTIQMDGTRADNVAKAQLDEIALKMQQNPQLRAVITGYTDDRGSDASNQRVGLRRAEALKDYLVKEHGIDAGRIETRSGGSTNAIADNTTAEGRKQNRRAEIELFVPNR